MNSRDVGKSEAVNRRGKILQDSKTPQHECRGDEDRAVGYVLSRTLTNVSAPVEFQVHVL